MGHAFPLQREIIYSPQFLDVFREALHTWTNDLFDPDTGGFRQNEAIGVNPLSSTDVIWMRYAAHDPDLATPDSDAIRTYLQGLQDPETGHVHHDPGPAGQGHGDGHAFWQTVRALNILGAPLAHPPRFLAPMLDADGLAQWFDQFDWRVRQGGNHHEVLGLVPVLASLNDPQWTEVFLQKIAEQQDTDTGVWPIGRQTVSRTFAYTALHLALGRIPPMPDRLLDTFLDLQQDDGLWNPAPAGFHTMDAIYVLTRLPSRIGYRESDSHAGLVRANQHMRDMFIKHQEHYCGNPHAMLAITHTFGLLQETFADDYPSQQPYRFDWDVPALYRCDAISNMAK
jgi:hypothetical protein